MPLAEVLVDGVPIAGVHRRVEGDIVIVWTSRVSGDFALSNEVNERILTLSGGLPVLRLQQVHGAQVVDASTFEGVVDEADGAVVDVPGIALSVITADCAPVGFWTSDGVIGVAHAGWRGLEQGVLEAVVSAVRVRSVDPDSLQAVLGPCIGPCCYEFGSPELRRLTDIYGASLAGRTTHGLRSLDLRAGVKAALRRAGDVRVWALSDENELACTACDHDWFSWRRSRDPQRQMLMVLRKQV